MLKLKIISLRQTKSAAIAMWALRIGFISMWLGLIIHPLVAFIGGFLFVIGVIVSIFVEQYTFCGFLYFTKDNIEIQFTDKLHILPITEVSNLKGKLNGYLGEPKPPYFYATPKDGLNNVISFEYHCKSYKFRLCILNQTELLELKKIIKNWEN